MKYDTIVVGAGKFGCVIAKALEQIGQSVLVLDDRRPMSGSRPSGGLMKPSWMTFLDKKQIQQNLELLNTLFGVDDISLKVWPTGLSTTCHHIPVFKVLAWPVVEQKVIGIKPGVVTTEQGSWEAKNIVVTAGVWTNDLLPDVAKIPGLYGKRGVSFLFDGHIEGFIRPWAPYKQIVAHKHSDSQFWAGDGTALLPESWTDERQQATEKRVCGAVGRRIQEAVLQHGIRPFVDGVTNKEPCYYKHHSFQGKNIFVVAGGGKNGMIASAWAASNVLKTLV